MQKQVINFPWITQYNTVYQYDAIDLRYVNCFHCHEPIYEFRKIVHHVRWTHLYVLVEPINARYEPICVSDAIVAFLPRDKNKTQ